MWKPIKLFEEGRQEESDSPTSQSQTQSGQASPTTNPDVPGTKHVIESRVSTGHFCQKHNQYIHPLYVDVDEGIVIACQDCFLEELLEQKEDIYDTELASE